MKLFTYFSLIVISTATLICAEEPSGTGHGYVLGSDDAISVHVADLEEFNPDTLGVIRIDQTGNIRLPLAGRMHAAGLTVEQLEKQIAGRLLGVLRNPEVTVAVSEFRSHPVSVLGAVKSPGVYQVTGKKTLFEVLSLAGGLNPDASNRIKITRLSTAGPLPLPNTKHDDTGDFYVGELNVRKVMEANNPDENINVLPNDVITVPKADLVYVVGAVHRSGGFPLSEKEQISVLQAVSLAEGLDKVAGSKNARILRQATPGAKREEIPVNVERILDGHAKDVSLQANDILFIPNNVAKSASIRVLEAVIQTGTGVAIYRR